MSIYTPMTLVTTAFRFSAIFRNLASRKCFQVKVAHPFTYDETELKKKTRAENIGLNMNYNISD